MKFLVLNELRQMMLHTFKHRHRLIVWAVLVAVMITSLSAIRHSLQMTGRRDLANDYHYLLHGSPSLGASLRILWQQLQNDTPPGITNKKIFANLKPRDPSPREANDIVLVTHCSLFKLETFLVQLQYWNGPASLALYMNQLSGASTATGKDAIDLLATFLRVHQETLRQTSIHLLMEYTNSERRRPLAYPHNPLRNLAMDNSDSDYILALDVDFIPNPPNAHDKLLSTLHAKDSSLAREMRTKKRVMVLPAFEVYASTNKTVATPDQLPTSKEALYHSVRSNLSETFRERRYPAGHGPTNFTRWFKSVAPTNPKSKPDENVGSAYYPIFYRPGFEPYVLAYRPGIPRYWNGFRGFGQNKLSWFQELHRAGYVFGSLWEFYVVHLQHPSTFDSKERNSNVVKNEAFLTYLNEQYPLTKSRQKRADKRYYYTFQNKRLWGADNFTASTMTLAQKKTRQKKKGKRKVTPKKKN